MMTNAGRTFITRIPILLASLHLLVFAMTVVYVYASTDPQASLVWVLWSIPDFPISLLYYVMPAFSASIHTFVPRDSPADYLLYGPHLIHGVFGTVWWYLIGKGISMIVLRRRDHVPTTG